MWFAIVNYVDNIFLYTRFWPFEPLFTKISFVLNLAYKINIDIIETTKVNQRLQGERTVSSVFLKKFSNGQKEQTSKYTRSQTERW